jgi:hypothetical protein
MTQQSPATQHRHDLQLIPPLAEEFSVYGGPDTIARARSWALRGRYLLADGIPKCAHGLYLMADCPAGCYGRFRQLDHVNVWVPGDPAEDGRAFLLSHPYSAAIDAETSAYAEAHGLTVASEPYYGDDWYGSGTIPVRMTLPANWPLWPIEAAALTLLATQPVAWPDDEEEGTSWRP